MADWHDRMPACVVVETPTDAWAETHYGRGSYRVWDWYDRHGRLMLVQRGLGMDSTHHSKCRVCAADGRTLVLLAGFRT